MRGAQSPGGGRSRDRGSRVYAARRVLAILLLLLVLALIIPRACQAIMGPEEDTAGSGGDRGANAPEKAAGGGAGVSDGDEGAKDEDASDGKGEAGGDEARGVKDTGGQDEEEKELAAVLTEALADREMGGTGSDLGVAPGGGAEQPAPTAQQPPAAGGAGPSSAAAPVEKPPLEPAPEPRARSKTGTAASAPARRAPKPAQGPTGLRSASVSKPALGPAQISRPGPINVAPVQPTPVAATPVAATPVAATPVQPAFNNTAFAGGGAVGPPVNNAAAFSGPAPGGFATGGSFAGVRGSF